MQIIISAFAYCIFKIDYFNLFSVIFLTISQIFFVICWKYLSLIKIALIGIISALIVAVFISINVKYGCAIHADYVNSLGPTFIGIYFKNILSLLKLNFIEIFLSWALLAIVRPGWVIPAKADR